MKDPFDLTDLSDLPAHMSAELSGRRRNKYLHLFEMARRPLSAREVVAALHRLDGLELSVSTVRSALYSHKKQGSLIKVPGGYALPEHVTRAED